jgi:type I restriction enzyme S subunit
MREDWVEIKLGTICSIQTGKHDANHAKADGRYKFFTCAYEALLCDTNRFKGESIILPGNGANVGEVFYYNGEFDAYQRTYVINDIKIYSKYLFYHLKAYWKSVNIDKQYGTATNYIRMGNFTNYNLPLYPLPIQRAIVTKIENLFASLDKGIADLKKAQEQLKVYRQAVLKKAFEGEFSQAGNITWGKLIDVIDSVEYGTSSKSLKEGIVPVLRMGNIQDGKIDWSNLKYSSNSEEIKKYKLKKYDVLFNRTNSPEHVGKTAIYLGKQDALFAGYLIRINYKKNEINPFYLNHYLNSIIAKQYGNRVKSFGVNQSNINGTKLKQYPFPNASKNIQDKIVNEIDSRLTVHEKIEEDIIKALKKSEALRQSILKKAFEGKLLSEAEIEKCKQEADYEPADVLLERIKREKKIHNGK